MNLEECIEAIEKPNPKSMILRQSGSVWVEERVNVVNLIDDTEQVTRMIASRDVILGFLCELKSLRQMVLGLEERISIYKNMRSNEYNQPVTSDEPETNNDTVEEEQGNEEPSQDECEENGSDSYRSNKKGDIIYTKDQFNVAMLDFIESNIDEPSNIQMEFIEKEKDKSLKTISDIVDSLDIPDIEKRSQIGFFSDGYARAALILLCEFYKKEQGVSVNELSEILSWQPTYVREVRRGLKNLGYIEWSGVGKTNITHSGKAIVTKFKLCTLTKDEVKKISVITSRSYRRVPLESRVERLTKTTKSDPRETKNAYANRPLPEPNIKTPKNKKQKPDKFDDAKKKALFPDLVHCPKLDGKLSVGSCVARFKKGLEGEVRFSACVGCGLGKSRSKESK